MKEITRINHVGIRVADLDATREFYEKLGFDFIVGPMGPEPVAIMQGNILEGSALRADGWKAYEGLILNGYDHCRAFHSKNECARGKGHVNGIESFWSFAKRRLAQFNSARKHSIRISKNVHTDLIIEAKTCLRYYSWY